jgi:hypothetical protein
LGGGGVPREPPRGADAPSEAPPGPSIGGEKRGGVGVVRRQRRGREGGVSNRISSGTQRERRRPASSASMRLGQRVGAGPAGSAERRERRGQEGNAVGGMMPTRSGGMRGGGGRGAGDRRLCAAHQSGGRTVHGEARHHPDGCPAGRGLKDGGAEGERRGHGQQRSGGGGRRLSGLEGWAVGGARDGR